MRVSFFKISNPPGSGSNICPVMLLCVAWFCGWLGLCGSGGVGKTLFHTSKARRYAMRNGKDRIIIVSGSIEPLAILSSQGELQKAGAIILADFDISTSLRGLSDNDVKALFDVRNGGSIKCKSWRTITFPPFLHVFRGSSASMVMWGYSAVVVNMREPRCAESR